MCVHKLYVYMYIKIHIKGVVCPSQAGSKLGMKRVLRGTLVRPSPQYSIWVKELHMASAHIEMPAARAEDRSDKV